MGMRVPIRALLLAILLSTTVLCATGHAQPLFNSYGESAPFPLNTNRIGFSDSALLVLTGAPELSVPGVIVALGDPLPNPFNPRVTIPFHVGRRGVVVLNVYDSRGRHVRTLANRVFDAGDHLRQWDGRSDEGLPVSAGVYLVRIQMSEAVDTEKISLVK